MRHLRQHRIAIFLAFLLVSADLPLPGQDDARRAAFSLEQEGRTGEAEAAWIAISKQEPSNAEPYAHLGLLEARQEHYPEAIRYYRKALALAPGMPGLRLNFGLSLFKNGDFKAAIAMFEPLLKQKPDDQQLTVLLGMSHYGLGEYADAATYLKRAEKKDPQNLTLLLTVAQSCLWSKEYPCVLDSFHQILALNAESAEADMLMGEALDEMKDHDGAIRQFRAA